MTKNTARFWTTIALALMCAGAVHAQRVPHQGDSMPYDDELYRHLIYGDYDSPGTIKQSRVLPYDNPRFYIRLGGPQTCNHNWRLSWREMHAWRALVPIIAEQLTGTPYTERVEVGCANREPEYGWIIVRYVTPAEYETETGTEWGEAWGRAMLGSTHGRIAMRYDGRPLRDASTAVINLIAHEIGHAFGLNHTDRERAVMKPEWILPNDFRFFTGAEEAAARRAYRAGRGARYCGDPDRCGNGYAPGYQPSMKENTPVIVVD